MASVIESRKATGMANIQPLQMPHLWYSPTQYSMVAALLSCTIPIRVIPVLLAGVLLLLVIAVSPEPSEATVLKHNDERRVEDPGSVIEAIHDFRNSNERLPYSLQELAESRSRLKWQYLCLQKL
jgi:hypothetical protein